MKWEDVEAMFGAEPLVVWDRDVADAGWNPVFRLRGAYNEELWADDIDCIDRTRRLGRDACRCVRWDGEAWVPRVRRIALREFGDHVPWRQEPSATESVWRREYLGRWVPREED